MALLVGCAAPTAKKQAANPSPEQTPKARISVSTGEGTQYSKGPKHEPVWTVKWKEATVDVQGKNSFVGAAKGVTGTIDQNGAPASDYSADGAFADKEKGVLALVGHVKLVSKKPAATLTCERVEYHSDQKLIKAKGNVRVEGPWGSAAGNEVWATPDLKQIGTPDMFRKTE